MELRDRARRRNSWARGLGFVRTFSRVRWIGNVDGQLTD